MVVSKNMRDKTIKELDVRMRYFITEQQRKKTKSTCYHEFFQGIWDMDRDGHWNENSLMIHDDIFCEIGLDNLIAEANAQYDYFGETRLTQEQWEYIVAKAAAIGGELENAIGEITPWAMDCYKENSIITILGM